MNDNLSKKCQNLAFNLQSQELLEFSIFFQFAILLSSIVSISDFFLLCLISKGQLISKRNSQAEDSPEKRTNEFVFTSMRRVFVRFLGES